MRAIDRKVWRELVHMRGQMLAILLVLACGIAGFVTMLSNLQALERSLAVYYDNARFAETLASEFRDRGYHVSRAADMATLQSQTEVILSKALATSPGKTHRHTFLSRLITVKQVTGKACGQATVISMLESNW